MAGTIHRWRVFKNRMLWGIFEHKGQELAMKTA
jgi:hypothetical protein